MKKQQDFKLFSPGYKWEILFILIITPLALIESEFFETNLFADFPFLFIYGAYCLARFIHIVIEKRQQNKKKEIKWDLIFILSLTISLVLLSESGYIHLVTDFVIPSLILGFGLGRLVGYQSNKSIK